MLTRMENLEQLVLTLHNPEQLGLTIQTQVDSAGQPAPSLKRLEKNCNVDADTHDSAVNNG